MLIMMRDREAAATANQTVARLRAIVEAAASKEERKDPKVPAPHGRREGV